METSVQSQETVDGTKLIVDFLKKCKEIEEETQSDEELLQKLAKLKEEVLNSNNKYVAALVN